MHALPLDFNCWEISFGTGFNQSSGDINVNWATTAFELHKQLETITHGRTVYATFCSRLWSNMSRHDMACPIKLIKLMFSFGQRHEMMTSCNFTLTHHLAWSPPTLSCVFCVAFSCVGPHWHCVPFFRSGPVFDWPPHLCWTSGLHIYRY